MAVFAAKKSSSTPTYRSVQVQLNAMCLAADANVAMMGAGWKISFAETAWAVIHYWY